MMIEGSIDGEVLELYVVHFLAPQLRPGDIIIWDNVPTHKKPCMKLDFTYRFPLNHMRRDDNESKEFSPLLVGGGPQAVYFSQTDARAYFQERLLNAD